jgi:hypothetical protein
VGGEGSRPHIDPAAQALLLSNPSGDGTETKATLLGSGAATVLLASPQRKCWGAPLTTPALLERGSESKEVLTKEGMPSSHACLELPSLLPVAKSTFIHSFDKMFYIPSMDPVSLELGAGR